MNKKEEIQSDWMFIIALALGLLSILLFGGFKAADQELSITTAQPQPLRGYAVAGTRVAMEEAVTSYEEQGGPKVVCDFGFRATFADSPAGRKFLQFLNSPESIIHFTQVASAWCHEPKPSLTVPPKVQEPVRLTNEWQAFWVSPGLAVTVVCTLFVAGPGVFARLIRQGSGENLNGNSLYKECLLHIHYPARKRQIGPYVSGIICCFRI